MQLLLWRHAEAEDVGPQGDDLSRRLTERGEQQAARVGRWLAERLPAAARVIASPAVRCQMTARALGRDVETVSSLASGCSAEALLAAAGWPQGEGCVLVVGHQPTLGWVAARLLCGTRSSLAFEKAAVWWLEGRGPGSRVEAVLRAVQGPDGT